MGLPSRLLALGISAALWASAACSSASDRRSGSDASVESHASDDALPADGPGDEPAADAAIDPPEADGSPDEPSASEAGDADPCTAASPTTLRTAVEGGAANVLFGASVSLGPDATGDGKGDILVGAPAEGRAYLHDGVTFALVRTFEGPGPGSELGASVSLGPDADGDGLGDVALGAPAASQDVTGAGAAYLHSGATGALVRAYSGSRAGDRFGEAVSLGPDADGDGLADLLVGAPGTDAGAILGVGRAQIFSAFSDVPRVDVWGAAVADAFGAAVALGPDLDRDGRGDFIVGAPQFDAAGFVPMSDAGRAYVYGSLGGAVLVAIFTGTAEAEYLGASVALGPSAAGADEPDVVIGAPGASPAGREKAGRALHARVPSMTILHNWLGEAAGDGFGAAVTIGGRVNDDVPVTSTADVAIGAPFAASACGDPAAGRAYLFNGWSGGRLATWVGGAADAHLGAAVSIGPDRGGSPSADFVCGAPGAGSGGRVLVRAP